MRNAFNDGVIAELTADLRRASARTPSCACIVLGGHGKAFCAGADLNWMRAMADYSWEQNHADAQALADMLWTIYRCPVPVVGRIHGDCYAGGVGLAAVCDVLVAAEGVQLLPQRSEARPAAGDDRPYVVRALGEQAARRYFVTAERFGAAQAQALGFVHEVVRAPRRSTRKVDETRRRAGGQRPDGGARLQAAGAGRGRPRRSTPRCAPTPRAASPTSAPATRAAKACSPSSASARRPGCG